MRRKLAAAVSVFALAGCGAHGTEMGLQDAALAGDFTVADVAGPGVTAAYVFCPYTIKAEAQRLGFDPGIVDACGPGVEPYQEIDPAATVRGTAETREYAGGETAEVTVLRF